MMLKKMLFVGFVALCFMLGLHVDVNAVPITTIKNATIDYDDDGYKPVSLPSDSGTRNYFTHYKLETVEFGILEAFCVEEVDASSPSDYEVLSLSDAVAFTDRIYQAAWIAENYRAYASHAAAQIAIWNLTMDDDNELLNTNTINGGKVWTSKADLAVEANNLISMSFGNTDHFGWVLAHNPTSWDLTNTQDYLIKNPVPEPATILLLGIGLVGLGTYSRKFRKA